MTNANLIGTYLGQYRLVEVVRRGGMAMVYKGHQDSLDRFVAVKVLPSNADPQFAARFKREARAIAALQHHNILPVYDFGEQGDLLFLVLQYVENGVTLGDMLGKPLAIPVALRLTSHVLDALEYAHRRGVIHRDIKPANVLMPTPNWPMLADFGIAKLMNDTKEQLTAVNHIIGTAAYMAPEQATGRPVDARTDIYATGVVLYELVTGRVPFDSDTPIEVLTKHLYETPPPPRSLNPDLPASVEAVLGRALAKDPAARYQTAAEMATELNRIADQLEREGSNSHSTGLYEIGVKAFSEGKWDVAVEQLGQLVELNPTYEDAAELLEAAREAQERTKAEARQQIALVRQRRQSAIEDRLKTSTEPTPVAPTQAPATSLLKTSRLPVVDEPSAEVTSASDPAPPVAQPEPRVPPPPVPAPVISETTPLPAVAPASTPQENQMTASAASMSAGIANQANTAQPVEPTPRKRRGPILAIAGAVAAVVLVGLLLILRPWQSQGAGAEPRGLAPTANAGDVTTPVPAATTGATAAVEAPTSAAAVAPPATSEAPTIGAAASSPAPLPEPVGQLVYEDDFGTGSTKSGLEDLPNANDFQRGFHSPGVYHFKILEQNATRWELFPRHSYRDFSMQIELKDNSDSFAGDVAQGIIFRARDTNHFYTLLLDPRKSQYSIRKQDGENNWSDLIAWKDSPLIKQQADTNLVRIDGAANKFTVYLNGSALDSFSDDAYPGGMIGMIVANVDAADPHMHFDNIKMWSDDVAAAPTLPITRKDPKGDMLLIPAGEFIMGSNEKRDELPHLLSLPDFYIDSTEVTNEEYAACVAAKQCTPLISAASETHPNYADDKQFATFPVIQVTWKQADAYCGWAGKRLPSEAEWEKAASWNVSTGEKSVWPWGDTFDPARLNSSESKSKDTIAVGQTPAESNGTFDMGGNVSEWTNSLFKPYPYNPDDGREDQKAEGDRVFRGGSWAQSQGKARTFFRQPAAQNYPDREIGFRCAAAP